jgi:hypothetical protein
MYNFLSQLMTLVLDPRSAKLLKSCEEQKVRRGTKEARRKQMRGENKREGARDRQAQSRARRWKEAEW